MDKQKPIPPQVPQSGVEPPTQPQPNPQQPVDFGMQFQNLANTPDTTAQFDPQDIDMNKVMAVLSYLGILVLVPIFGAKESRFARFHANQGLILCICSVVLWIVMSVFSAVILAISWRLSIISSLLWFLVSVCILVFAVLGIVNAAGGKAKELPIIGKYRLLK